VLIASIIGDVREALLESGSLPSDIADEMMAPADVRARMLAELGADPSAAVGANYGDDD
jgi:hypothetical protein